jgi:putative ABC transport system permease protein
MTSQELTRLASLFDALVRLTPEEFQRRFARDMGEDFRRRAARACGRSGLYAFALRNFLDVAIVAVLEHAAARRRARGRRPKEKAMNGAVQDAAYAFRTLKKSPAFAAIAISTLALGIAVNTAIFSVVGSLLFAELPVKDPDRFGFLWAVNERAAEERSALSLPDVAELRARSESFEAISVALEDNVLLTRGGESRRLRGFRVTDNIFDTWGIEAALGRTFLEGEDRPGGAPVALVSHGYWKRELGGDPAILGTTLTLDGRPRTVVGVVSPRMEMGDISRIEVWIPLGVELSTASRDERIAFTQARVKETVSLARAQEELDVLGAALSLEHPESEGWSFRLSPISEELLGKDDRALVLVIGISVAFVLLIACVNVANMLMARSASRSREIAVRLALGVSRARLVRQLLIEGGLLAGAAALAGLVLARALLNALILISAGRAWVFVAAAIDGKTLAFTLAIAAVTPLLFALVPSLKATRPDLTGSLKEGARSGTGRVTLRSRGWLVTAQVAMALTLMVVTGLLVRTLIAFKSVDLGFDSEPLLVVEVDLPRSASEESIRLFADGVLERALATPGAVDAAIVSEHPLSYTQSRRNVLVEGHVVAREEETPSAVFFTVSPGYLSTMGIPLLRGRDVSAADTPESTKVALLNRTAVERFFADGPDRADGEPLGRRIQIASAESEARWLEIVGVVGNVLSLDPNDPEVPQVYLPFAQSPTRSMALLVKAAGPPEALSEPARSHVASLATEEAVEDVRAMEDVRAEEFANADAIIALFVIFAAFALAMASMGIYGVMSYSVSQRERELGIRIALGARRSELMAMIGREGAKFILLGAALGLLGALAVGRILSGVVFGVSVTDPATFASVTVLLGLVAVLANWAPARRATRVDPISTLRAE